MLARTTSLQLMPVGEHVPDPGVRGVGVAVVRDVDPVGHGSPPSTRTWSTFAPLTVPAPTCLTPLTSESSGSRRAKSVRSRSVNAVPGCSRRELAGCPRRRAGVMASGEPTMVLRVTSKTLAPAVDVRAAAADRPAQPACGGGVDRADRHGVVRRGSPGGARHVVDAGGQDVEDVLARGVQFGGEVEPDLPADEVARAVHRHGLAVVGGHQVVTQLPEPG